MQSVRLLCVTKTVSSARIREVAELGVQRVGESRIQEALDKQADLSDLGLEWHLIGHLQTNKVKRAIGRFALVHSVDSLRVLTAIDEAARAQGIRQDVLLQVNVAKESTKFGFRPEEVSSALGVARTLASVRVRGLMTIAPQAADPERVRWVFRGLRELRDACQPTFPEDLGELSMGMSTDFQVAIAEGATMVRIGTGIFGERPGDNQAGIEEAR